MYDDYGAYNEITNPPAFVTVLIRAAEQAGIYATGIESNRRQRGTSINVDVYGYDAARMLAVIQVRQCQFRPGRFNRVRKDYYLLGYTEDGAVFAHPIESPRRLRSATTPEQVTRQVLCRIWACADDELDHIIRQGDVALIPDVLPADAMETQEHDLVLRESHHLSAEHVYRANGTLYVGRGAVELVHTPGQHKAVRKRRGCYRVQLGLRASVWGFTAPSAD